LHKRARKREGSFLPTAPNSLEVALERSSFKKDVHAGPVFAETPRELPYRKRDRINIVPYGLESITLQLDQETVRGSCKAIENGLAIGYRSFRDLRAELVKGQHHLPAHAVRRKMQYLVNSTLLSSSKLIGVRGREELSNEGEHRKSPLVVPEDGGESRRAALKNLKDSLLVLGEGIRPSTFSCVDTKPHA